MRQLALFLVAVMGASGLSLVQIVGGHRGMAPASLPPPVTPAIEEETEERARSRRHSAPRPQGSPLVEPRRRDRDDTANGSATTPARGLTARADWSTKWRHRVERMWGLGAEAWRAVARPRGWPVRVRDLAPAERGILLVTEDNRILRSQANAFACCAGEIRRRFGAVVHEQDIACFEARAGRGLRGFDTVVLQPWFDIDPARLLRLVDLARGVASRVVFMDGYAPTDLRFAHLLDGRVDYYVKKHVLRDRSAYGRPTLGDTNLTDHYSRRYGLDLPSTTFPVSADFLRRLIVGPSFFTDRALWARLARQLPDIAQDIDVHARLGIGEGWGWYSRMRQEAVAALRPMADLMVLREAGVPRHRYLSELIGSKMCFSPFGFGEIAWRDFEAMACGSLLIKPDCSHLELEPDVMRPFETYVPIRWDFADLEEKVRYYRDAVAERRRIVANAHAVLRDYLGSGAFLDRLEPVLRRPS